MSEIVVDGRAVGPDRPAHFTLLLLTALRAPRYVSRAELAALLWPEVPGAIRNHRLRSLLHRTRQAGATLECTDTAVRLIGVATIDFRDYSTGPRSLEEAHRRVAELGPILPGLRSFGGPALETRLDDERDVITGTVVRWVRAALDLARGARDWTLVEELARAGRRVDPFSEEIWHSLAEAQCLTASAARARQTLDEYRSRIAEPDELLVSPTRPLEIRQDGHRAPRAAPFGSRRVIHFAARPEHEREPLRLLLDLAARLLEAPGAAGCEPAAYATLRLLTAALPNGCGALGAAAVPQQLLDAFLELLAALSDEAMCVIIVGGLQPVAAETSAFWRTVLEWSAARRLAWNFVSRPTRLPSVSP